MTHFVKMKKISILKNAQQSITWSLLVISIPLMLSSLSGSLMLLCDRLFFGTLLSNFSEFNRSDQLRCLDASNWNKCYRIYC